MKKTIGCIFLMMIGMGLIGHTEITSPILGFIFIGIAGWQLFKKD